MDNEDTCGFTLRHWLCYMIDKEKIPGLKWITPADQYGKSHARDKFVRIPWNRQGQSPFWKEEYELFRLWAKHRGKYDETSPPDYTKWKSNFRSVLGKSNDFEEVKEANVLDQQMGNYKVFRLKSSSEVKAEAARRSRKKQQDGSPSSQKSMSQSPHSLASCSSSQSSQSQDFGNPSSLSPRAQHEFDDLDALDISRLEPTLSPSMNHDPFLTNSYNSPNVGEAPVFQQLATDSLVSCSSSQSSQSQDFGNPLSLSPRAQHEFDDLNALDISRLQPTLSPSMNHDPFLTNSYNSPNIGEAPVFQQLAADRYSGISVDTGNVAATFSPSNVPEVASGCFNTPLNVDVAGRSTTLRHDQSQVFLPPNVVEVPENQIEDVLRRFGDLPERFQYALVVRYRGAQSLEESSFLDASRRGVRLMYGDDASQMLNIYAEKPDLPPGFELKAAPLRKYYGADAKVEKVLDSMDQGIALRTDAKGNLYGRRLCQSHAFFYSQENGESSAREPTKMERKKAEYLLFSYQHYFKALLRSKYVRGPRPPTETTIYFGALPKDPAAIGLVTVTLAPKLVALLGGSEDGSSLELSTSDSIDFLLRNGFEKMDISDSQQ